MLFALKDLNDLSHPSENQSQEIGRRGLVFTQNVLVNNHVWGFYKTDGDDDHGIDATLEPKKQGKWTGQLISAQIKATNTPITEDDCYVYYIKPKHFNYWTHYSLPVIIILCILEEKRCYWAQVSPKTVVKTKKAYKILIPNTHLLGVPGRLSEVLLSQIAEEGNQLQSKVNIFFKTENLIENINKNGKVVVENAYNASSENIGGYRYIDFTLYDHLGNNIGNEALFIPFFSNAKPDDSILLVDAIREYLPWADTALNSAGDIEVTLNQYGQDFWKIKDQLTVR